MTTSTQYRNYLVTLVLSFLAGLVGLALYIEFFPMNFFSPEYAMAAYQKEIIRGEGKSPHPNPLPEGEGVEAGVLSPGERMGGEGKKKHADARIIILGDSRAMAGVIPKLISEDARSLCLSGGTSIELYFLIKEYLKNHKPPELVFLSIAPFHLKEADVFWERTVKFKLFENDAYKDIFKRVVDLNDPVLGDRNNRRLLNRYYEYRLNWPFRYGAELVKSGLFFRRRDNLKRYAEMVESKGQVYFGMEALSNTLNQEAEKESFEVSRMMDAYLNDLLGLLRESGVRVVMEAMPMNKVSRDALSEEYLNGYIVYMEKLKATFSGLEISEKLPSMENECFGDSNHLNPMGAEKYSRELAERIGEIRNTARE